MCGSRYARGCFAGGTIDGRLVHAAVRTRLGHLDLPGGVLGVEVVDIAAAAYRHEVALDVTSSLVSAWWGGHSRGVNRQWLAKLAHLAFRRVSPLLVSSTTGRMRSYSKNP